MINPNFSSYVSNAPSMTTRVGPKMKTRTSFQFFQGASSKNWIFPRKNLDFVDFLEKISLFSSKNSDDLFLVIHRKFLVFSTFLHKFWVGAARKFRFITIFTFQKWGGNCLKISISNHFSHIIFFFQQNWRHSSAEAICEATEATASVNF